MSKQLNPGAFSQRITFYSPPTERDDYGEPTGAWIPHRGIVRASAEPLVGRELYAALTAETKVEIKFRMRWLSGVDETMRISWNGGTYGIISAVDVDAAHRELVCYCRRLP